MSQHHRTENMRSDRSANRQPGDPDHLPDPIPTAHAAAERTGRPFMAAMVVVFFVAAAGARVLAETGLAGGPPWAGPLELRLTYNSGVAFGLGNTLPGWVITAVTGAVIVVIGVYAWRTAPSISPIGRLGLAAILAGALANLTDRAPDGVVTDYLHTGWFPTFNLPDIYITCGAVALLIATLRTTNRHGGEQ